MFSESFNAHVWLQTLQVFIAQLLRRARLLNEEFQARAHLQWHCTLESYREFKFLAQTWLPELTIADHYGGVLKASRPWEETIQQHFEWFSPQNWVSDVVAYHSVCGASAEDDLGDDADADSSEADAGANGMNGFGHPREDSVERPQECDGPTLAVGNSWMQRVGHNPK